jgi:succinate dehydrogenase/fumarate reductase flavoprotein subunit
VSARQRSVAGHSDAVSTNKAGDIGCSGDKTGQVTTRQGSDGHVDVLVAGCGPAGASAAIAAHDEGANVLVVEKRPRGGGNAMVAGGFLWDVRGDEAVRHVETLFFGKTDRPVAEAYVRGLNDLRPWISELGGEAVDVEPPPGSFPAVLPSWPHVPGGDGVRYWVVGGQPSLRRGQALWQLLAENLAVRGITVRYGQAVAGLAVGDDGGVSGAEVTSEQGRELVAVSQGVVLACGGFEADDYLKDAFLPVPHLHRVGHDGNTGDAVRIALQVGAALWHMSEFFGWFAFKAAGHPAAFAIDFHGPGFVLVNAAGHRFGDETGYEVHERLRALVNVKPALGHYPALPVYGICDGSTLRAGALSGVVGTPNDYQWSRDNLAEVRQGWITSGGSPGQLAERMGLDPAVLTRTLAGFNAAAAAGRDPEFGRRAEHMAPLDLADLYAIELWPAVATTSGGPRRDAVSRVVRPDGTPVPGLYAAGGAGTVWGPFTHHGGGLTDALVFGRLAGQQAARSR